MLAVASVPASEATRALRRRSSPTARSAIEITAVTRSAVVTPKAEAAASAAAQPPGENGSLEGTSA